MEILELVIDNSFCLIRGNLLPKVEDTIREVLTYKQDIDGEVSMLFGQLNMAKRFGNKARYDIILKKIKYLQDTQLVCWYEDGVFPTGHLNIVKDVLALIHPQFIVIDNRVKPESYVLLPWANKPHEPRYYQKEMIELGMNTGRGVFEAAVGSGKSLVMTYLIKNLGVNSLVVVPSGGLSEQLYRDLKTWFGTSRVEIINNKKIRSKTVLKPIRIITIQSLAALQKSGDLGLLIGDIDALFLDEFHHAGASSYTNLLSDLSHVYYRFGFTGTFLRNDSKSLDMWGFLSNKIYSFPAWKAIQEGFLTPVQIHTYPLLGKKSNKYQTEYDNNYCGAEEILETVADICGQARKGEQILILVNKKDKGGKIFYEYLKALGFNANYISGDDSKEVINNTITEFNDKKISILIGSSVIGEGIDVRSTDHLIMAQGGKSEVIIVQAVGRAVRLYEGKKVAKIHDFNFLKTKFMYKHYLQRKNIYERNFQPEFV